MFKLLNFPSVFFILCLLVMLLATKLGASFPKKEEHLEGVRQDFGIVLGATLTLLGLIIGFTFSMAVSRYDQRKNLEEEEANAIGTEYARADLLPPADAEKVRMYLKTYLKGRVQFYKVSNLQTAQLYQVDSRTAQLQTEMWAAVTAPALAQPSPVIALVVSGMNDVLNSQGYTQAAWLNRIPVMAWGLMVVIALLCNFMLGYGAHKPRLALLIILPLLISVSFMLIGDIDSPRGGLIRLQPKNLIILDQSLQGG
jgi:hypothetical protein